MELAELAGLMTARLSGKVALGGTLKFDLGSGGSLFVDGTGAGNTVTANRSDGANTTISMAAVDFDDLIHGRLNPTLAFMEGKMRIDGDMNLVVKLGQLSL